MGVRLASASAAFTPPPPRAMPPPLILPRGSGAFVHDDDDDDDVCPICAETLDDTDRDFKPCPCGFQFCCFCYGRLRDMGGEAFQCPACRKPFAEDGGEGGAEKDDGSEEDTDESDEE